MLNGFRRCALLVATVGPCGFAPVGPGTVGSVAGLLLFWAVRSSGGGWLELLVLVGVIGAGVIGANVAEAHYQRHDPSLVVIDEVAGMLVTLFGVPVGPGGVFLGFLLFRAFDIAKPFPVRQVERFAAGWGVMADDLMAGLYAQGVLRLVLWQGWGL